jgi:hypothetical protein
MCFITVLDLSLGIYINTVTYNVVRMTGWRPLDHPSPFDTGTDKVTTSRWRLLLTHTEKLFVPVLKVQFVSEAFQMLQVLNTNNNAVQFFVLFYFSYFFTCRPPKFNYGIQRASIDCHVKSRIWEKLFFKCRMNAKLLLDKVAPRNSW